MKRAVLTLCVLMAGCEARGESAGLVRPRFDDPFWKHWSDGKAELAGYTLKFPRYGEARDGVAVTIFVTETFSESLRVKSDPGRHPASDEYPVMKLNLVKDFFTGIYDYNTMTSSWVTLAPRHGRGPGAATKVSYSSQEWCGHVYHHLLFDDDAIRETAHSYFDGEADRSAELAHPRDGVSADMLLFWARGFAAPLLAPGESVEVAFLPSLEHARLKHQTLAWTRARLSRRARPERISVAAGSFEAEVYEAAPRGLPVLTFFVEREGARRVLRWTSSDGEIAELQKSARLEYWRLNGTGKEALLGELGLRPRGASMP